MDNKKENDSAKLMKVIHMTLLLPTYTSIGWGLLALFMVFGVVLGKELAVTGCIIIAVSWSIISMIYNGCIAAMVLIATRLAREERQKETQKNDDDEPPPFSQGKHP